MTEKDRKRKAFKNLMKARLDKGLPTEKGGTEFIENQEVLITEEVKRLKAEAKKSK